jgi:hypothetical protein
MAVMASTMVPSTARVTAGPVGSTNTQWQRPAFPGRFGGLAAVDVEDQAVVTVGFGIAPPFLFTPLAAVWNGASWERQPVRLGLGGETEVQLTDLDVYAPNQGWAVGRAFIGGSTQPVAARWNGKRWKGTPTDAIVGSVGLHGVVNLGPRDAWAVGQADKGSLLLPAIAHWDGKAWSPVDAPPLEGVGDTTALSSISAESPRSVWAVGGGGVCLHYDGTQWQQVPLPRVGDAFAELASVRGRDSFDTMSSSWLHPARRMTIAPAQRCMFCRRFIAMPPD